jgi:GMP synthase-like glutamine amidotransferase
MSMAKMVRVLILDLLVERAEFGHGGNQEVIRPLLKKSDVEVLLLTPQMQSFESGLKAGQEDEITLKIEDVPYWDNEYPFWENNIVELESKTVNFNRIIMPMLSDEIIMKNWVENLSIDALICSGSRRNVSIWEEWMGPASTLMRVVANSGIPTLGICFGHQLLCHSLGSQIKRADSLSSGIWELKLTELGKNDPLLTSHLESNSEIFGLYTHQDHVDTIPDSCNVIGTAEHNAITAIRVKDKSGKPLPAWGIQFHPEAARKRIERAYEWGHITEEEFVSFKGEHDGANILSSFARIVSENTS